MPKILTPEVVADYYDEHADHYLRLKQGHLLFFNEAIEIPATLTLLEEASGELAGREVLDVGCGLGTCTKMLAERGARVTAIDISRRMIQITKGECAGLNVRCLQEDLFSHGSVPDGGYDVVVAGFMLGYFSNIGHAFRRFRDIVSREGIVITSSIHPSKVATAKGGHPEAVVPYFDRSIHVSDFLDAEDPLPLHRWLFDEVTGAAHDSDFVVDRILEPRPVETRSNEQRSQLEHFRRFPSVAVYLLRRR